MLSARVAHLAGGCCAGRFLIRLMTAVGRVSRGSPVQTAMRNCTRDEGRLFEVGNQVLISSHRKLVRQSHACNPHGAIIALQHPDISLVWVGSWLPLATAHTHTNRW